MNTGGEGGERPVALVEIEAVAGPGQAQLGGGRGGREGGRA